MNTIKRDVYVLRDTIKIPIEVTKGTDMVGFEFAVRDYSIPETAAAVAYVYHKSMDKPKGILCDVNDSTISFTPDNNFFAVGMNELQIRVINNEKSLISFKEKVKCSDTMGFPDDEEESQQTLVEQLLAKIGTEEGERKEADETEREERIAADSAEEDARTKADEAIRANRMVTLDEIDLVTEEGFFVDALAVKELNSKTQNILSLNTGASLGGIISIYTSRTSETSKTARFICQTDSHLAALLIVDQNRYTDLYTIGAGSGAVAISKKSAFANPTISNGVISVPLTTWAKAVLIIISESAVKVE